MKTESGITHHKRAHDFLKSRNASPTRNVGMEKKEPNMNNTPTAQEKVSISDKAKTMAKSIDVPTQVATNIVSNGLISAGKSLVLSSEKDDKVIVAPEEEKKEEEQQEKTEVIKESAIIHRSPKEKGFIKKPGFYFITGMESFSLSTDYDGIRKMAESVSGARLYSWNQKDEIIDDIKKRAPDQPIALVGHSFGGDTAVEVANELNTLENNFRKVNFLATLDSVGSNNDIIPQNVAKNYNFFGEKSWFFNHGPNVARNTKLTEVINELRPEEHTELDNSNEIQFQIISEINSLISKLET